MKEDNLFEYDKARHSFKKWCDLFPSLTGFEFGSVRAPGLSDLDLGLVVDIDAGFSIKELEKSLKYFPKDTREVMNGGTLMLFQKQTLRQIQFIDDIKVNIFDSNPMRLESLSENEEVAVRIFQVLEWLPERVAKIYAELNGKNEINKKRLVGFHYSMCYSLKRVTSFCGKNEEISLFIQKVNELRSSWMIGDEASNSKQLDWLNVHYISVVKRAMNSFSKFLRSSGFLGNMNLLIQSVTEFNLHSNVHLLGCENMESLELIDEEEGKLKISVPYEFLFSYWFYASLDTSLGKKILNRFVTTDSCIQDFSHLEKGLDKVLQVRGDVLSEMFEFTKSNGLKTGLYKFGWYLND